MFAVVSRFLFTLCCVCSNLQLIALIVAGAVFFCVIAAAVAFMNDQWSVFVVFLFFIFFGFRVVFRRLIRFVAGVMVVQQLVAVGTCFGVCVCCAHKRTYSKPSFERIKQRPIHTTYQRGGRHKLRHSVCQTWL